jgi:hypothetical protein
VAEDISSKHEALSSNPSTAKTQHNKKCNQPTKQTKTKQNPTAFILYSEVNYHLYKAIIENKMLV